MVTVRQIYVNLILLILLLQTPLILNCAFAQNLRIYGIKTATPAKISFTVWRVNQ